jgi:hypothetical protein
MSSHREAPEISKDPVADSTDVYAFVSPDRPKTVTLIANYIPLQGPAGGPNFYQFGDHVRYAIHIDTRGHSEANITYEFEFKTDLADPETFLYNTGPITSLTSANWNRKQRYSVTRVDGNGRHALGRGLLCPPCNIGPLSTPNYQAALAKPAVHTLSDGSRVFAGQRAEGFYVDLGSIFDLGNLRPFQNFNVFAKGRAAAPGVNATKFLNVHSIAIQVPISRVTAPGRPVIGVWTTASRQRARLHSADGGPDVLAGPFHQVSRLGNPLVNEVLIPIGKKDFWNTQHPVQDKQFAHFVAHPELARLLPVLYPGVFPNLAALDKAKKERADLGHLAHRHSEGHRSGIHQFHRAGAGRHAAAQHVDPADHIEPERLRVARRRRGGLPERTPGVRRCRLGRVACRRRGDLRARRPGLHRRRRRRPADRRPDSGRSWHPVPEPLPLPRRPLRRLQPPGALRR